MTRTVTKAQATRAANAIADYLHAWRIDVVYPELLDGIASAAIDLWLGGAFGPEDAARVAINNALPERS